MTEHENLTVGKVLRPHGVRGDLLVAPYSETIRTLEKDSEVFIGSADEVWIVSSIRSHRKQMIMHIQGCDDRDTAETFRGREIMIPLVAAEPLPENVYYRWQILGLAVWEEDGAELGEVVDILETGANDVYVVQGDGPRELLLPAIESVILDVDLDAGRLLVRLPDGLA